jgi:hypothetical protein
MRVTAVLTAAFWVLITVGGAANHGYLQYEQYVSSLASSGVAQPWWGRAAMACLATSLLIVGPTVRRWNPQVGWPVALAGAGLVVATAFPVSCPPGEPFCRLSEAVGLANAVHGAAVLAAAACLLFAAIAAGVHLWRGAPRRQDAVAAGVGAATALTLIGYPLLTVSGLQQRVLLVAVQAGLIAAAAAAHGEERRLDRQAARSALEAPHSRRSGPKGGPAGGRGT